MAIKQRCEECEVNVAVVVITAALHATGELLDRRLLCTDCAYRIVSDYGVVIGKLPKATKFVPNPNKTR